MDHLEQTLNRNKNSLTAFLGGVLVAGAVFVSMGLTQLRIEYTPPEESAPIQEYHLPPPPPPANREEPKKEHKVSISFSLPTTPGPGDIPLGFLNVDFGLKPKQLTQARINAIDTVENYETDGLDELSVYEYKDVTEKPERTFLPALDLSSREIAYTKKPFTFIVICRITKQGRTSNIHIIDCPYPEAVPTLKKWIEGWRFRPAKKDGEPVDVLTRRHVTYNPSTGGSPFSI